MKCIKRLGGECYPVPSKKNNKNTIVPIWGVVDLDLPSGNKWATKNVGAESETDYGMYFQWGDISGYTTSQINNGEKYFDWTTYKYANGDYNKLTKYCNRSDLGDEGFTDSLTTLENADDAAFQASNGQYRMPTGDEYTELINNTTNGFLQGGTFTLYEWGPSNGLSGYSANQTEITVDFSETKLGDNTLVGYVFFKNGTSDYTSAISNGEYLFFPTAGICYQDMIQGTNTLGGCWSSSFLESGSMSSRIALSLAFYGGSAGVEGGERSAGLPVRGILIE